MSISDHFILPVLRDGSHPNNYELDVNLGFVALAYLSKSIGVFPRRISLEISCSELQWFRI